MVTRIVVGIITLFLCLCSGVLADEIKPLKGVALVVGQAKYQHLPPLKNPHKDADSIAQLFTELGFTVTVTTDRDTRRLRRDLENFVTDAEDADVAAFYYSGHGIEAGGESWLVPVSADVASLDGAERSLVALSPVLDELKSTVPLNLIFLDACRDSPFPPGSMLKSEGRTDPVAPAGLTPVKGAMEATTNVGPSTLGTLLGFAAEPGRVALDGPAGQNSPYAAALLRHMRVSTNTEFGVVMRMVTEEVYLRTKGLQRPWVNETLIRLLYFGGVPEKSDSDEGRLDGGRRTLLLTIASLPQGTRKTIEQLAQEDGLPLDPLYGMLSQLDINVSASPEELDKQLRAGMEKLRQLKQQHDTIKLTDPEITRYTELADRAQAEGVILLAKEYRAKASERATEVSASLDRQEDDISARRLEVADTYAKEAETAVLSFEHDKAAQFYGRAAAEIERWDNDRYLKYKIAEAAALMDDGDLRGNKNTLARSIELHRMLIGSIERVTRPDEWALLQSNLGIALQTQGTRSGGSKELHEAIAAYRTALEVRRRDSRPVEWARTLNNLGTALWTLGVREDNMEMLESAASAFQSTLEVRTHASQPQSWATTQNNLGGVLWALGDRTRNSSQLEQAIVAYHAALLVRTRESAPLDWAKIQNNLGVALQSLSDNSGDDQTLATAIEAYRLALQERTRERAPLDWAASQNNLGIALQTLGQRHSDSAMLKAAVDAYKSALQERTRSRSLLEYAQTKSNLADTLLILGEQERQLGMLREAESHARDAWAAFEAAGLNYDDYFIERLREIADAADRLE